MTTAEYRMCTRCIMDTSDPNITFDENGWCNHCRNYARLAAERQATDALRQKELDRLVTQMKAKGKGRQYDCILGVSGGSDSTYAAYLVHKLGLKPLAVHLDNGWNTELSESNVRELVSRLGFDLYAKEVDFDQFKDLQLAFLKASVPDAEIPTDHAIWALLYQVAKERNVPYVITGSNFTTEGITPSAWTYGIMDWRYIERVHRQFGTGKLRNFPHLSFFTSHIVYPVIHRIQWIRILNYVTYDKASAMVLMEKELGWRPYGGKHYESVYTRFIQGYVLPRKFNIDKRKSHASALIMAGQKSRDEALAELEQPPLTPTMLEEDMEEVLEKLDLSSKEFEYIIAQPIKTHRDYPTARILFYLRDVLGRLGFGRLMRRIGVVPS